MGNDYYYLKKSSNIFFTCFLCVFCVYAFTLGAEREKRNTNICSMKDMHRARKRRTTFLPAHFRTSSCPSSLAPKCPHSSQDRELCPLCTPRVVTRDRGKVIPETRRSPGGPLLLCTLGIPPRTLVKMFLFSEAVSGPWG